MPRVDNEDLVVCSVQHATAPRAYPPFRAGHQWQLQARTASLCAAARTHALSPSPRPTYSRDITVLAVSGLHWGISGLMVAATDM